MTKMEPDGDVAPRTGLKDRRGSSPPILQTMDTSTDGDVHAMSPNARSPNRNSFLEEPKSDVDLASQLSMAKRRIIKLEHVQQTILTRLYQLERSNAAHLDHAAHSTAEQDNGFELSVPEPHTMQHTVPQNSFSHRPPRCDAETRDNEGVNQAEMVITEVKDYDTAAKTSKSGESAESTKSNQNGGKEGMLPPNPVQVRKLSQGSLDNELVDLGSATGTGYTCSQEGEMTDMVDEQEDDTISWLECSHNAYGVWIHIALQGGLLKGTLLALPMVLASTFVQIVFSAQLLNVHINDFKPEVQLERNINLCKQPILLQMCAMAIYVILMSNNVPAMWRAARVSLTASHCKGPGNSEEPDNVKKIQRTYIERAIIFVIGVLLEVVSWALLLIAGILWINAASDVDLVIRSTVSIMFVLNVDEIMYDACCASSVRDDMQNTSYRVRNMSFMDMQANITDSIHSNQYIVRKVKFSGLDLAAKDSSLAHGRSSDPYLLLLQGGKQVGRSTVIQHNLNPNWPEFTMKALPGSGDILVQCWDYDSFTKDDLIGELTIPISKFRRIGRHEKVLTLVNKDDKEGNSGKIRLEECKSFSSNSLASIAISGIDKMSRISNIKSMKHFLDVYLFLCVLILITILLNYIFKEVVQSGCTDVCYWGPCD